MKGFLALLLFSVFLSVCFVCVEEMKRNYGVTSSSISMNCSDCWFHPVLVSNKYLSLTCLPWLLTQAHGAWLCSSNRQLSRDGVRQPCWTSPWEPCCGKGAHLFEDARYCLVRPCVTLKLLHVEPIYRKKPWWASCLSHLLGRRMYIQF